MSKDSWSIEKLWGDAGPFYIRKVGPKWHWCGKPGQTNDERIETVVRQVFPIDEGKISIFKVSNDVELIRVCAGFRLGCEHPRKEIRFLGMVERELAELSIEKDADEGTTKCLVADDLHYNIRPESEDQIRNLVRILVQQDSKSSRLKLFSKDKVKFAISEAERVDCHAFREYSGVHSLDPCDCEREGQPEASEDESRASS